VPGRSRMIPTIPSSKMDPGSLFEPYGPEPREMSRSGASLFRGELDGAVGLNHDTGRGRPPSEPSGRGHAPTVMSLFRRKPSALRCPTTSGHRSGPWLAARLPCSSGYVATAIELFEPRFHETERHLLRWHHGVVDAVVHEPNGWCIDRDVRRQRASVGQGEDGSREFT